MNMKWAVINKMSTPMQNSSVTDHGGPSSDENVAENNLPIIVDGLLKSEKYKEVAYTISWIQTLLCDDQVQGEYIRRGLREALQSLLQLILILEGACESELVNQTKAASVQGREVDALNDANRTMTVMQNPASKEAMGPTYSQDVEVMCTEIKKMKQSLNAMHETNATPVKEGGESEVRNELVQCRLTIENLTNELNVVKGEKQQLQDQLVQNGTTAANEKTLHKDQLYQKDLELEQVKEANHELQLQTKSHVSELEVLHAKLTNVTRHNEELEGRCQSVNGEHSDLMERVAMLEREKADLIKVVGVKDGEVEGWKEEWNKRQDDFDARLNQIQREHEEQLAHKDSVIQQLQSDLDDADHKLDNANRTMKGMQSPKSREAMESTYNQEVEVLRTEMKGMKQLLKQMNKTNDMLEVQLGQARDENRVLMKQVQVLEGRIEEVKRGELKESQQQLEELAVENKQALAKLNQNENELFEVFEALVDVESKLTTVSTEKESLLSENESLAMELNEAQEQTSHLQSQIGSLKDNLADSQQQAESLFQQKNESDQKLHELSNQLQSLTTHLEAAQGTISSLEEKLRAKNEYCEQFEGIERKLIYEKNVLNEMRRTLHNKVMQLSGNIRVYVRVRPLISSEQHLLTASLARPSSSSGRPSSRGSITSTASSSQKQQQQEECFHFPNLADRNINGASKSPNYTSFSDLSKQTLELIEPLHRDRGGLKPRRTRHRYGFDKVFTPENNQVDVWEDVEPLVQSAVDGYNVCMFAYGQTSSGKTHTMIGDSGDSVNRGLIPRAIEKLFVSKKEIEHSFEGDVSVSIKVELLEVYNDEVFDLLDTNAGPKGQKMKIKLSSNEAVNNVVVKAASQDKVQDVLELAQQRRCVEATKLNAESSRSHLLFTIRFELSSLTNEGMNREGILHIVDLAGSECLDKSGSQGTLLTEAKHINTSLSALSRVIQELQDKSEHIPYRDSTLTYLLRDSLGGDSKTLCIVCCSPHQAHFKESLNSLRFAANASKVELKQGNKVDV